MLSYFSQVSENHLGNKQHERNHINFRNLD